MNVSMGDTFNLGWKLISVLEGHSDPMLLATYSEERRATAKALIDFDHQWSRAVSAKSDDGQDEIPVIQRKFVKGAVYRRFDRLLRTLCDHGKDDHQSLATGLPMGERFHSAPVVRLADAKPMELGHAIEVGHRWTCSPLPPKRTRGIRNLQCGPCWTVCKTTLFPPSNAVSTQVRTLIACLIYGPFTNRGFGTLNGDRCTPPCVQPRAYMA